MKITDYSSIAKTSATAKKKGASATSGAGNFLGLLGASEVENASAAEALGDMQPVTSMNALLALQEMPEDEVRRRAVQEGESTLEALETLRLALLSGNIPQHLLHQLTQVVAQKKQQISDPALVSVIEDIELRAAVELAKLERAALQDAPTPHET